MADVRDILELERASGPEGLKDAILGTSDKLKFKKGFPFTGKRQSKKPEGMARELYALLTNDGKDVPPMLPTDTGKMGILNYSIAINYGRSC